MSAPGEHPPPSSSPSRSTPATPVLGAGAAAGDPRELWAWEMAPGAPRAVERGCLCSVLANAAYRAHAEEQPFVDPDCPVHGQREPRAAS